jgi:thioredoxin 1
MEPEATSLEPAKRVCYYTARQRTKRTPPMAMKTPEIGGEAFSREVIRADRPVLASFYAPWCSQSLEMTSAIEKITDQLNDEVKVVRIDATRNPALCERLGVSRFPTQLLFFDGAVQDKILGKAKAENLIEMVRTAALNHRKAVEALDKESDEILDLSFGRQVLQSETPVMVLFWDTWCASSVKLGSRMDEVANHLGGKCKILRVQASRIPQTCARLGITRLPIIMMFQDGEVVDYVGGLASRENIINLFEAGR